MQFAGAAIDFSAGDFRQPRHRRVGLEVGFLLGHGQYRTQVFITGGQALRSKGGLDISGPALAIGNAGRQQLHDPGPHLLRGPVG